MKTYKVIVDEYGAIRWYNEAGQLHREGGPAIEYADGTKVWYLNGQYHREDGPAIEWADGSKFWYLNGQLHREDGPAIKWVGGNKSWYLNGQKLTEKEFNKRTQPHREMTVAQLEQALGYKIKIVKG